MRKPLRSALLLLFATLGPAPAPAGEWRCHREYYLAEIRRAEAEAELDCAQHAALLDRQRRQMNQTPGAILTPYHARGAAPQPPRR